MGDFQLKTSWIGDPGKGIVLRINVGNLLIRVERPLGYFLVCGNDFINGHIVEAPDFGREAGRWLSTNDCKMEASEEALEAVRCGSCISTVAVRKKRSVYNNC